MLFELPSLPAKPLAEVELEPKDSLMRSSEAVLKPLFTGSNRVIIQDVLVSAFTNDVAPDVIKELEASEIKIFENRWPGKPEFKLIVARLTCIPAPECCFTWLRAEFKLGYGSDNSLRPIACKLFPELEQDTIEISRTIQIDSKLNVKFAEGGSSSSEVTKFQRKLDSLRALGEFSSEPAWDLSSTEVKRAIIGDFMLLIVAACPEGERKQSCMNVSASVQAKAGPPIPLIMRRTSENAPSVDFVL